MIRTLRTARRSLRAALAAGRHMVAAAVSAHHRLLVRLAEAADTGATVRIRYTDSKGDRSVRDISPRRLWADSKGHILVTAFDHRDGDTANFRTDRIELAVKENPVNSTAAANLREQIARRALATINTPANAQILRVVRTGTVLIVATHTPGQALPYCVDSYRLLSPAERAQEADWGFEPRGWTLTEQQGNYSADDVDDMIAAAVDYARNVTLPA